MLMSKQIDFYFLSHKKFLKIIYKLMLLEHVNFFLQIKLIYNRLIQTQIVIKVQKCGK